MKKCAIMKPGVVIKDASLDTRDQHVKQFVTVICTERIVPCVVDTVGNQGNVITSMGHV